MGKSLHTALSMAWLRSCWVSYIYLWAVTRVTGEKMQLAANTLQIRKLDGSVSLTTGGVPFSVHFHKVRGFCTEVRSTYCTRPCALTAFLALVVKQKDERNVLERPYSCHVFLLQAHLLQKAPSSANARIQHGLWHGPTSCG